MVYRNSNENTSKNLDNEVNPSAPVYDSGYTLNSFNNQQVQPVYIVEICSPHCNDPNADGIRVLRSHPDSCGDIPPSGIRTKWSYILFLTMMMGIVEVVLTSFLNLDKDPIISYLIIVPFIGAWNLLITYFLLLCVPRFSAALYLIVMIPNTVGHLVYGFGLIIYGFGGFELEILEQQTSKGVFIGLGSAYLGALLLYLLYSYPMILVCKGESPIRLGLVKRNVCGKRDRRAAVGGAIGGVCGACLVQNC